MVQIEHLKLQFGDMMSYWRCMWCGRPASVIISTSQKFHFVICKECAKIRITPKGGLFGWLATSGVDANTDKFWEELGWRY